MISCDTQDGVLVTQRVSEMECMLLLLQQLRCVCVNLSDISENDNCLACMKPAVLAWYELFTLFCKHGTSLVT